MSDLYVEARKRLVDWLERQLIGPAGEAADGDEYEIDMSPLDRYPVGVLHPLESEERGIDPASDGEADEEEAPADGEPGASNEKAAPLRRRRYVPPSSVGFSFCVRGDVRLWLEANAAVYEQREGEFRDEGGRFVGRYVRRELESASVAFAGGDFQREEIWSGRDGKDCEGGPGAPPAARAGIDLRSRPLGLGKIVTVTLFNRQEWEWGAGGREAIVNRVERSLFEARLQCLIEGGEVVDYPRVDPGLLTDEERELELQYRERRIFAVGHGAAVDWEINPGEPSRISSKFLPRVETPIVSVAARGAAGVLEMERLASDELPMEELRAFVGEYAAWVRDRLVDAAREKDEQDRAAALRITERMKAAHERMLRGVEMLGAEPDAALAFRLANRAMLRQMVQFRGEREAPWSWRPFQLGFLLATIGSTVEERDDHRGVLDLIWFQTGGGKTEAYLGLIAFLLVWRRLRYGEVGGGTAAFMRYTLRLLTRQQFERAARLICALELERREDAHAEGRLGDEPFSIGIWVGGTVCPNQVEQAQELAARIRDGDDEA